MVLMEGRHSPLATRTTCGTKHHEEMPIQSPTCPDSSAERTQVHRSSIRFPEKNADSKVICKIGILPTNTCLPNEDALLLQEQLQSWDKAYQLTTPDESE